MTPAGDTVKPNVRRPNLCSLVALATAIILHIANPLAVSGQGRGVLTAHATVLDARASWTAQRLVEDATSSVRRLAEDATSSAHRVADGAVGPAHEVEPSGSAAVLAPLRSALPSRGAESPSAAAGATVLRTLVEGPVAVWIARLGDGTHEVTVTHLGS